MVGRIAGIAIFSLAIACLPRDGPHGGPLPTLKGLLLLSALVTAYLVYLGVSGSSVGVLLWPAAATHFLLGILLAVTLVKGSAVTN
jgi:hypothetical protein